MLSVSSMLSDESKTNTTFFIEPFSPMASAMVPLSASFSAVKVLFSPSRRSLSPSSLSLLPARPLFCASKSLFSPTNLSFSTVSRPIRSLSRVIRPPRSRISVRLEDMVAMNNTSTPPKAHANRSRNDMLNSCTSRRSHFIIRSPLAFGVASRGSALANGC